MILGIRPEHLTVTQLPQQTDNAIPATVNVIEPLGDRKDVYLTDNAGQKFIANIDPHIDIKIDEKINVYIDVNKIHIFEPGDTGLNISL